MFSQIAQVRGGGARAAGRLSAGSFAALLAAWSAGCAGSAGPAPSTTYNFWPPFPEKPRIQFLVSYESSRSLGPPKSALDRLIYGKEAEPELAIVRPYGVDMHDGKIYVCDPGNADVTVIDVARQEMRLIGVTGTGKLSKPVAIAVAGDGMKYVADTVRGVIFVYDANDKHVGNFGRQGLKPASMALYGDILYVCDFATSRIEAMDRHTGKTLRLIGEPGKDVGQLAAPIGVSVDVQGNLHVVDMLTCRVQKFDPAGRFLLGFGEQGDVPGTFTRPKHLAVDSEGIVYVVDNAFQNVQMFNPEGQLLMYFGGLGDYPGSMDAPAGICVREGDLGLFAQYVHPAFQAERLIIVTSWLGHNKVAVYAFGQERAGMSVGQTQVFGPTTRSDRLPGAPDGSSSEDLGAARSAPRPEEPGWSPPVDGGGDK